MVIVSGFVDEDYNIVNLRLHDLQRQRVLVILG